MASSTDIGARNGAEPALAASMQCSICVCGVGADDAHKATALWEADAAAQAIDLQPAELWLCRWCLTRPWQSFCTPQAL